VGSKSCHVQKERQCLDIRVKSRVIGLVLTNRRRNEINRRVKSCGLHSGACVCQEHSRPSFEGVGGCEVQDLTPEARS
jgi:hypothetical protein